MLDSLGEPIDELQKSYDQFLHRMEKHKKKKIQQQELRMSRRPLSSKISKENNENSCNIDDRLKEMPDKGFQDAKQLKETNLCKVGTGSMSIQQVTTGRESEKSRMFHGDDTVVVKFAKTAIVGKSDAEDACHHGLVDPTINMKEAMNAINSMFREPLEMVPISRRSQRNRLKEPNGNSGFSVFIDEDLNNGTDLSQQIEENNIALKQHVRAQASQPQHEPFQIFIDDEENGENDDLSETENLGEGSSSSSSHLNAFVFPCPKDVPSENSDDISVETSPRIKLREDTVVHRFVGSTIQDEPAVENVCHHGLVDPTINLKEAMDDINNMFGKPIDFVRKKRAKKQEKAPVREQDVGGFSILPDEAPVTKQDIGGFSILPDDDFEHDKGQPPPPKVKSTRVRDTDLFEPTVFTKEAMDDINKLFGMPLDF